jgi:hypothetical protein
MTDISCTYGGGRDEAIVALLYDETDGSPAERARFEAHVQTCASCRAEVAALRGVRTQLARWSPPEPINLQVGIGNSQSAWWRQIPAWAQVAAAMLFLGVSAGIANLDVRYDQNGLSVKTGWSGRSGGSSKSGASGRSEEAQAGPANAPWKADLTALESQLQKEIRAASASGLQVRTVSAGSPASDADVTRRVRALLEESEKRQQRELALRIAELLRDVNAQRQADLVKIDRTLGVVQNNVGIEVMKNRQQINTQMDLLYRASQKQ